MITQRLLIDQNDITKTRLHRLPQRALDDGEARLVLETCALTANNVTYAAVGFTTGYWTFFPTGMEGQGLVPVWGVAEVAESRADALPQGTRLYGFYPLAEELIITPQSDGHGMIVDAAPHRADLPAVYNRYAPVKRGPTEQEHLRALLQPLLATSYLLFDWLVDHAVFGAEQIVIGSASSKTGLGLCKFLAEPTDRAYRIVGLTSPANHDFVTGLNACDEVLDYDQIEQINQVPSVFVDMAGNGAIKAALHRHLGDNLKHSAAVGLSHWDKFEPGQKLAGPKPQFFFAPAQIAKRREEWGPGVIEARITESWKRIAQSADQWLTIKEHQGIKSAAAVFDELSQGRANPRDGHVIRM